MGIVNATPDSFYDGGRYPTLAQQAALVDRLLEEGAALIDIGGESTKPGSTPVPAPEQIARIDGVVRHACSRGALVSIDTTEPEVADHALGLGARLVNDVSCLANVELARVVARHGAFLLISHSRGKMATMPGFSQWPDDDYDDIVNDVAADLERARQGAMGVGVPRENILFDPGLGFSKNARHSFVILQRLNEFKRLGAPLVVGPARKSFIAKADALPAEQRLGGTIAACVLAAEHGADILRVHDVEAVRQALAVAAAIRNPDSLVEANRAR
ncbi:MAG TPA: dihydropteroate synthase [Polyangiaceae bacterium]|nr:dihydropteroate synthase [Polyangiaceae bacterium]